jgi:hypothetical protein
VGTDDLRQIGSEQTSASFSKSKYLFFESELPTSLDGWDSKGTPCERSLSYNTSEYNLHD